MSGIRDRLDEFLTFDTEVLAISCDPVYSLRAFADADGLNFPLLSDFWPHGAVTRAYGVFDEARGAPRRSSYILDKAGTGALVGAQREPRRPRSGRAPQGAQGPGLDPGLHLFATPRRGMTAFGQWYTLVLVATAGDPRRRRSQLRFRPDAPSGLASLSALRGV